MWRFIENLRLLNDMVMLVGCLQLEKSFECDAKWKDEGYEAKGLPEFSLEVLDETKRNRQKKEPQSVETRWGGQQ